MTDKRVAGKYWSIDQEELSIANTSKDKQITELTMEIAKKDAKLRD